MSDTNFAATARHFNKESDNTIMGKTLVADFTGKPQILVKLHAEDHGLFRFEVLAGNTKGSVLWVPATSIESLREANDQEIENQMPQKREGRGA